jgi:hypothetical protein
MGGQFHVTGENPRGFSGGFLDWCGRGDSNPHGIATASPSSWCVCQFRHFRKEGRRVEKRACAIRAVLKPPLRMHYFAGAGAGAAGAGAVGAGAGAGAAGADAGARPPTTDPVVPR